MAQASPTASSQAVDRSCVIEPIVLTTARLTLSPIVLDDAAALFETHADPAAMRYWSAPPWTDRAQALEVIAADRAALVDGTSIRFALRDRTRGEMLGCCSLYRIDRKQGRADVGYILRRVAWGRGVMSEALTAVIDHAIDDLGLRRLEADIDPRNGASTRLVERLGFVLEATLRERWCVAGEISDSVIYGLLADEWRSRSRAQQRPLQGR